MNGSLKIFLQNQSEYFSTAFSLFDERTDEGQGGNKLRNESATNAEAQRRGDDWQKGFARADIAHGINLHGVFADSEVR